MQRYMFIILCVTILLSCLKSKAQKPLYTKDRTMYINAVLSDTDYMGGMYFITFKVKAINSDSIYTYFDLSSGLFHDLKKVSNWSGAKYMTEMKKHLLNNQAFSANEIDTSITNLMFPIRTNCTGVYDNLTVDSLIFIFNNRADDTNWAFDCLLIKLLEKNVYISQVEERILMGIPPEYQDRPPR